MVIGRGTAAASISKRGRRALRIVLLVAFAMFGIPAAGPAHASTDVYVVQDGTPVASKPGIGGKILFWLDTGFPLTVVGREGEWLKVSSSHFKAGGSFWVPAARVGRHLPGSTETSQGAVHVRTDGSWSSGDDFFLPRGFIVLRGMSENPFPPGNPTPTLGNPVPAFGNPVPSFQQPVVPSFQQPAVPSFQQAPPSAFMQSPVRAP